MPDALLVVAYGSGRTSATVNVKTDASGYYAVLVPQEGWCTLFVLKDLPETPGVDYVPAQMSLFIQKGGSYSFSFHLRPGASIIIKGDIRFVESAQPATDRQFTVISPDAPIEAPLIGSYGGDALRVIGLNATHIVVPANTPVWLEMTATVRGQLALRRGAGPMVVPPALQTSETRKLSLGGEKDALELSQGRLVELDVERHFVELNLKRVEAVTNAAMTQLTYMEDLGLLVSMEHEDLQKSISLLNEAVAAMRQQLYDEAYGELRRSYLLAAETWNRMASLSVDASNSATTLTFFFALTAAMMINLLSEGRPVLKLTVREKHRVSIQLKPIYLTALYGLLMAVFYVAFPGCRLVAPTQFIGTAVFSLIFTFLLARVPRSIDRAKVKDEVVTLGRALIVSFSAAYGYMRRRRLRTTLSIVIVATAMFTFITLTSFSSGRGLVSFGLGEARVRVDALMVKNPGPSFEETFTPLEPGLLQWLEKEPGVTRFAAKAESIPRLDQPLDYLRRLGQSYYVTGILGVMPSVEANITGLDRIVVEGTYLRDEEPNDAMIGASLAKKLALGVGDDIYVLGRRLTIVGLFDEKALESLRDVSGALIIPYILVPTDAGPVPSACKGDEVVITIYETALTMPGVGVSRVNILAENREKLQSLAEEVVLTYEYVTYLSVDGQIRRQALGPYFEEKGMGQTLFIVALIALMVGNMMFGAVHERRNELAVFSSVGLNPSHISAIFLSEAAIIGFIGGGLGYLAGICSYRALGIAIGGLLVREKASVEWGLAALIVSILATVLGTVIPALRASTIVTPSLLRRWKIEERRDESTPWVIDLPVKVRARELNLFLSFLERAIAKESSGTSNRVFRTSEQAIAPADIQATQRIRFGYHDINSGRVSRNELVIAPAEEGYYKATLYSHSDGFDYGLVRETGSFLRNLMFEWNVMAFKVATPIDSLSQVYTLVDAYHPTVLYAFSTRTDVEGRLGVLRERWLHEGTRVPKIVPLHVDEHDVEACLSKAEEAVSEANVVCVTGGATAVGVALTLSALKHGKMICFVTDPRSPEEQRLDPFHVLPIEIAQVGLKGAELGR
ncbi:MAG: FtsX-like permease family protein [Candidatus Bathyarchaeia archaeon]